MTALISLEAVALIDALHSFHPFIVGKGSAEGRGIVRGVV